jgi:hypothetical protein
MLAKIARRIRKIIIPPLLELKELLEFVLIFCLIGSNIELRHLRVEVPRDSVCLGLEDEKNH